MTRHAALAWAVDTWSQILLTSVARRRVHEARREAMEALTDAPLVGLSASDRVQAGLPDGDEAAGVADALSTDLV